MDIFYHMLSIILLVNVFPVYGAGSVGDSCLQRNGKEGICGKYSSCEKDFVVERPKVCSYGEDEAVVCCTKPNINNWKGSGQRNCKYYKSLTSRRSTVGFLNIASSIGTRNDDIPACSSTIGLIVNGVLAKPLEFPHFTSIGYIVGGQRSFKCGGSLISERFTLTAAHCASDTEGNEPQFIRMGDLDLTTTSDDANAADYDIEEFIKHPEYKPLEAKYNDIALIKLKKDVRFTPHIRPACLSFTKELNVNLTTAIGQGALEQGDLPANVLYKVDLDILDSSVCNVIYRKDKKMKKGVISSQICAGSRSQGDTCNGDSGAPIQIVDDDNSCIYHIIGVTSFGKNCGGRAALYTKVSSYLDWIEKTVWG